MRSIEEKKSEAAIKIEQQLKNLQERVHLVKISYNPDNLDLHFDFPSRADSTLFEALFYIGQEAWNIVENNQSWKTAYWFYDFFLLISSASVKILHDRTQEYFPKEIINRIVILLVDTLQMTTTEEYSGDITKRNYEALSNLMLAFKNYPDLRTIALNHAEESNDKDFVDWVREAIKESEK
jgi:hypothetical protein